jgi:hypothetical protein
VSKTIVDRHEGRLNIRSSERDCHHGTVVQLFLPFDTEVKTKESPIT